MPELARALRAGGGKRLVVLQEVAERVTAGEAERDPVAERPAALLLDPVPLRPLALHARMLPAGDPDPFR